MLSGIIRRLGAAPGVGTRFAQLILNSGLLLSGNLVASVLGLVTLALAARALGPDRFGLLVLVTTYGTIMTRLFAFQSWQTVIRYGAESLEPSGHEELRELLKLGFLVDALGALSATLIAIACAYLVGGWFGWDSETVQMAVLYCLVISTNVIGTPTAILRLFNLFRTLALQNVAQAVVRLLFVLAAYYASEQVGWFLLAWAVSLGFGNILLCLLAARELSKRSVGSILRARARNVLQRNTGLVGFFLASNLDAVVRTSRETDVPLVGLVMSTEAVGLYKVGRQFAAVLTRAVDPFFQAVYPELSRLIAAKEMSTFWGLVKRASLLPGSLSVAAFLGFLLCGEWVIGLLLGPSFVAAFPLAAWCMAGTLVWGFSLPLSPAMLALDRHRTMLLIHAATTLLYLSSLVALVLWLGLIGAGVSYLIFHASWTTLMVISLSRLTKGSLLQKSAAG